MKQYELGAAPAHDQLPAEITIEGDDYYLILDGEQYALLSRFCPHAGGTVIPHNNMYFCPQHMWRFDAQTGACLNVPGCGLDKFPVEDRNGTLVAILG